MGSNRAAPCRHCKVKKANRPRGLCYRCYYTPGVLGKYPSTSKYGEWSQRWASETEADLDRLIEQRRKNLPKWWDREQECESVLPALRPGKIATPVPVMGRQVFRKRAWT